MSSSDIRFLSTRPGSYTAIEFAVHGFAPTDRSSSQAETLSSPAMIIEGMAIQDATSRNRIMGSQAQPGTEMLDCWETRHIQADFREDFLEQVLIHAGYCHQIDTRQMVHESAAIIIGGIFAMGIGFWIRRQRWEIVREFRLNVFQQALNLLVAFLQALAERFIHLAMTD